ncbi:hydroxyacid dehydrogenase [Mesoaciditoga sp.]
MARILINDPLAKEAVDILKNAGFDIDEKEYSKEELIEKIKEYDGIIVRSATKVTKEIIEAADKLKVIGRAGVGLDNIDLKSAKEKGIKVLNTPTANSISVAELVFAFMISLSRHVVRGTTGLKEGKWEKKALKGVELFEKTLGIIGFGHIGKEVAKRALAFGMKVITYDVIKNDGGLPVKFVELDELLKNSDYVTVHLPLLESTRHLITAEKFSMMKPTAFFIHAARGGIVDDKALYEALKDGKIAGAALDVFESEPPDEEEMKLLKLPNVIGTPHVGASTVEAQRRVGLEIANKIVDFFREEEE